MQNSPSFLFHPLGIIMFTVGYKDRDTDNVPFYVVHGDVPALL